MPLSPPAGLGIGQATAHQFIAEGARVIATDINTDSLRELMCETHVLDVTDTRAVNVVALSKRGDSFNMSNTIEGVRNRL